MKKALLLLLTSLSTLSLAACGDDNRPDTPETVTDPVETTSFVRGVDISWYSEMAAMGHTFRNAKGEARTCPVLMRELGMQAARFRVWVNPEHHGTTYNNTADVVAKARAAHAAGLDVMIDFHYSDTWADPAHQALPEAWTGHSLEELKADVRHHTADVLTALRAAGVKPRWVQVGNETNPGFMGEMGTVMKPRQYAALFTAGAEAAKSIFPETQIVVHLARGFDSGTFKWNLDALRNNGAKFDLIGMSVYPAEYHYFEGTQERFTTFWSEIAQADVTLRSETDVLDHAFANIDYLAARYGCPVLIVETGMPLNTPMRSAAVLRDLVQRARASRHCHGIFYWEPQTDGAWRPAVYETLGWAAYGMGAFTPEGQPSTLFEAFAE